MIVLESILEHTLEGTQRSPKEHLGAYPRHLDVPDAIFLCVACAIFWHCQNIKPARCKHKMTDVRQKCNMYATTVFCASDGKIPIEMLCQRHRAPTRVYTTMQNIKWKYNCTIAIANLQLQTYWVPHSQPEIGGVWTLRTLALWMYGQCLHRNVKYEEY